MTSGHVISPVPALDFPGGEMAGLIASKDWSSTPLGPIESWPRSLRTAVNLVFAQAFPMLIWWGPDHIQIYNDACRPILGAKHPQSLGEPASKCWQEVWPILQPLIDTPYHGGPSTWMEDLALEVNRHGFLEETHFTVAYSPLPDPEAPNGAGGVLATAHEITEKVVGERRLAILHDVRARVSDAKTPEEACSLAAATLERYSKDVPFALFYVLKPALLEEDIRGSPETKAVLAGAAGVAPGEPVSPAIIALGEDKGWPLGRARGDPYPVEQLRQRFASVPQGPWPDPPDLGVIVPLRCGKPCRYAGFSVLGASPRLCWDDQYRNFFELLAGQVAAAMFHATAYEQERKRAEALAELERAKTTFLSNVSHELQTPLTLLLGPIERLLHGEVQDQEQPLRMMRRNVLRLQKLVNSLLDFSRIDAGRVQAVYEPTDLALLTNDLCSSFRSTVEKAGLELSIDCPSLPQAVYVDREMWEKIVLNLLSNAFKFTFEGGIEVRLRAANQHAELSVRDTGVGIAGEDLARVFDRFHRVEGARSRAFEGTGLGLALVRELVHLHRGAVRVESDPGRGSTFTVSIPFGTAHLPLDGTQSRRDLASTAVPSEAYVEEAVRWLPATTSSDQKSAGSARILVVDDNADMRDYLVRLLGARFEVTAAKDGEQALQRILESPPELVIADVMMPGLDGFGLLRQLRSRPDTRMLPVILLSARAGEESRVEGVEAGADDYLVKPFSARELVARARAQIELARMRRASARREEEIRRHSEQEFRVLANAIPNLAWMARADGWVFWFNERWSEYTGATLEQMEGWGWQSVVDPEERTEVLNHWREALQTGSPFDRVVSLRGADDMYRPFLTRIIPIRDATGRVLRWFGTNTDVSEQKNTENALRRANADLEQFAYSASHDLQEPIRNVAVYAELLQRRYGDKLDEEGRRALRFMNEGARRMEMLVRDLLIYRQSSEPSDEPVAEVDANAVLDRAVADLAGTIQETGARVTRGPLPLVRMREVHLEQLFQNLIGNALKYRGADPPKVHVSAERAGDYWRFAVRDNGIGIDPKYREVIFGIFKRLHGGASRSGTGIGLAICQRLVERYGGRIWVESELGKGATFFFTIRAPGRAS